MPPRRNQAGAADTAASAAVAPASESPASASSASGPCKRKDSPTADDSEREGKSAASASSVADKKHASAGTEPVAASATSASSSSGTGSAAPSSAVDLHGKQFIVLGSFKCGKYKIESAIMGAGGVVAKAAARSLSYVVCGEPVASDEAGSQLYHDCQQFKLPVLSEDEFHALLAAHEQSKLAITKQAEAALIPDLSKIVAEYAMDQGIGGRWLELSQILGFEPEPGVSNEAISEAEAKLQVAFPPYLKSLLKAANGWTCDGCEEYDGVLPGNLWKTLETIVKTNSSVDHQEMLRTHRLLCIDPENGQNRSLHIDLESHWLVEICVEPDMDGVFVRGRSLESRVQYIYDTVMKSYQLFRQRLKDSGDESERAEFKLLRKEAEEDAKNKKRRKDFYFYTPKGAGDAASASAEQDSDTTVPLTADEREDLRCLKVDKFGINYQLDRDPDLPKLEKSYVKKIMKAYCKVIHLGMDGMGYSSEEGLDEDEDNKEED